MHINSMAGSTGATSVTEPTSSFSVAKAGVQAAIVEASFESFPQLDLGSDSILSFVHVPKTAGTTLYHYLDTKFLPHEVFPADRARWHGEEMARMEPQWINAFRAIRGHFGWEQLETLRKSCRRRIVRFTLLRHPESHVLSEYRMLHTDPNAREDLEVIGGDLPFERFIETPQVFTCLSESRLLAQQRPGNRQCAHLLLQEHENPFLLPEDEWLPRLIEYLETYLLVGVQDQVMATVQLLAAMLGWDCPADVPRANADRGEKMTLTKDQSEHLRELNHLDFELYNWAAQRLKRQFASLLMRQGFADGQPSDAEIVSSEITTQSASRRAARLDAARHNPTYSELIDAKGLLLGHVSRDWKRQLNWIGPENKATFRLCFSTPGDRVLRVELLYWLTPRMLNDFYVVVNGHPIQMTRHQDVSSAQFVGYLPDYLIGRPGEIVEIELGTSSASTPAALGLNPLDDEVKCVAVSALNCFPSRIPRLGIADAPLGV